MERPCGRKAARAAVGACSAHLLVPALFGWLTCEQREVHADDPTVPNMKYTFQQAFAEILPHNAPELFWERTASGELEFAVPGWDVTTVDYAVALATGKAPLSEKLTLRRIANGRLGNPRSPFTINKYLAERGDTRVKDWASWVANAKFENDEQRAGAENAIPDQDPRSPADAISYLKMQSVLRMVILKVMYENNIDVFVNPERTSAPYKLGEAAEPEVNDRPTISCSRDSRRCSADRRWMCPPVTRR